MSNRNNGVTILIFRQVLVTQEPVEDDHKFIAYTKYVSDQFHTETSGERLK